jgi:Lon protease-like protein
MTTQELLPLFPLGSILFPGGRMPLQIFEARYLDLVKDCMRSGSGFGVCLIAGGDEVVRRKGQDLPSIQPCGVLAKIVDWDGLPNNRLAITIEGGCRFRLLDTTVGADQLMSGTIEWLEEDPATILPEAYQHLPYVVEALLEHPMVKELGVLCDFESAVSVGNVLSQLLPFSEQEKFTLLTLPVLERLERLSRLLEDMGGGKV